MENFNNLIYQARYVLKSNWLQAVNILENALKDHPEAEEIHMELAEIYSSKGAYEKTLQCYQKVLNLNPNHSYARFKTGNIYLELQEPKLALYHYDKITEDYPEALYNKAIAYRNMQKYDDAVKTLKVLINHPTKMIGAYKYLVELLVMFGKTKEALRYIDEAEQVFGSICTTHYMKGLVYSREKNIIRAYNEYLYASKDDSEYPHIHRLLAKLALVLGQTPNALKHLKDAIFFHKGDTEALQDLVELIVKQKIVKDVDELREYFQGYNEEIRELAVMFYEKAIKEIL